MSLRKSLRPNFRTTSKATALVAAVLLLAACSTDSSAGTENGDVAEITIETNTGEKSVPVNPERVAVLDNTAMETIKDWGIEPVVLPKPLLPEALFSEWIDNPEIADAGSHREPILEAVSEAEPDLIIGGYRFGEYTDDLEKIAPDVDIATSGERYDTVTDGLRHHTGTLGEIVNKEDEAAAPIQKLKDTFC